jgi:hypothetical protein
VAQAFFVADAVRDLLIETYRPIPVLNEQDEAVVDENGDIVYTSNIEIAIAAAKETVAELEAELQVQQEKEAFVEEEFRVTYNFFSKLFGLISSIRGIKFPGDPPQDLPIYDYYIDGTDEKYYDYVISGDSPFFSLEFSEQDSGLLFSLSSDDLVKVKAKINSFYSWMQEKDQEIGFGALIKEEETFFNRFVKDLSFGNYFFQSLTLADLSLTDKMAMIVDFHNIFKEWLKEFSGFFRSISRFAGSYFIGGRRTISYEKDLLEAQTSLASLIDRQEIEKIYFPFLKNLPPLPIEDMF